MSKNKKNDWKKRDGIVFSTASDYEYNYESQEESETIPPAQQTLRVSLDKSGRAGKQVTLISGFIGTSHDLDQLAKLIKKACGVGGSVKDNDVVIQGDLREKIAQILAKEGYRTRRG